MEISFLRNCRPPSLQADAALVGGLSYTGATGAAALAAAAQSTLVHEAVIAASTGTAFGFLAVLGVLLARQVRRVGCIRGRFMAAALAAALSACSAWAPPPRLATARAPDSQSDAGPVRPSADCGYYDGGSFNTPDPNALPHRRHLGDVLIQDGDIG